MDVRCERCKAQYVFDDDRITSSGLTVQCTHCGHLFKVKKKELVVTVPVRPGEAGDTPIPATAAAPRPSSPAIPAAPRHAAPPVPAPEAEPPPPSHDVDLTFVDEALAFEDEPPPARSRGSARFLIAAFGLAVLGGAGWLAAPLVLGRRVPSPAPVAAAREPPPVPAPAAPPAPAPVPAPQLIEPQPPPPIPEPPKPVPAPPPKGPKVLLAQAKALLDKGNSAAALELFGRVASQDPDNVEAQVGRGLCYLDLENWAPAEASFQAALRLQPDHADALLGLAETYRSRGLKDAAIAAYERYLARYPGGEEAEVAKNALAELRN